MDALREAIKKIHAAPEQATSRTLSDLIKSLDSGGSFDLNRLYQLNYSDFSLALTVLQQWRLDSYCYERGTLAKAASDMSVEVDVTALRYGRREQPSPA
jgi:hypothetical protein